MTGIYVHGSLAVLGVLLLTPGAPATPCTVEEIDRCLKPLDGYEYEMDNAIVPTMDEQTLKEHCRRYDLFEDCMRDVKPQCGLVDRRIFEGIEDSYQFLCYDGFDEYKKHRNCFRNEDLHREGDTCNETLTTRLDQLSPSNTISYRRDRVCQYVKQYLHCVEQVVDSFCGADAADWQRTLDTKSLQPLLDEIDCSLSTNAPGHWLPIVLGVLIGVAFFIVLTAVALVYKKRRARRQRPATVVREPSSAPPPYCGPTMVYNPAAQAVTSPQADPVPAKVEPPPYQLTAADTAPTYEDLRPSPAGAAAVPYFGVNPAVSAAQHGTEAADYDKIGALP